MNIRNHESQADTDPYEEPIRRRDISPDDSGHGSGGYSRDQKRALWWIVGTILLAVVSATVRHEVMLTMVVQTQQDTKEALHEVQQDVKTLIRRPSP